MEEIVNKSIYKIGLFYLKIIPILLAGTALLNTILSFCGIDLPILAYIGGVSILSLVFLYIASYMFKFCSWHRAFLHYVLVNWILNIVDYYIGIPVSDKDLFLLYMGITGIFLIVIAYLRIYKI